MGDRDSRRIEAISDVEGQFGSRRSGDGDFETAISFTSSHLVSVEVGNHSCNVDCESGSVVVVYQGFRQ